MATLLYGTNSPSGTVSLPDCGPVPQPYPALLPASLDWPLEEKELPDPLASEVCLFIYVCVRDLHREMTALITLCTVVCVLFVLNIFPVYFFLCVYRYCSYAVEDGH